MKLRLIPAGEFMMGALQENEDAWDAEKPRHRVEITNPFYLGIHEVTQEQWQKVMGTTLRELKEKEQRLEQFSALRLRGEGPDYPVYYVSWREAGAFCEKLSEIEGETYRLPTEAEWEYACRAGSESTFYWGDNNDDSVIKQYAWYKRDADEDSWTVPHSEHSGTQPVGRMKPNPWGLYDMSGNVWEYCSDRFDRNYYSNSPVQDPQGPSVGDSRIIRGGCWTNGPEYLGSCVRVGTRTNTGGNDTGFRVVREVK